MTKLNLMLTGAQAAVRTEGLLTSGMVGVPVELEFDEDWNFLTKNVIFQAGGVTACRVDVGTRTTVPSQVLEKKNCTLYIGACGVNANGTLVIPTIWAEVGVILPGADLQGEESGDPALPAWQQIAKTLGDIEKSLEGILTLQRKLIGGDGV